MDKDEALRIALEALVDFGWHIENCPQFPTWAEPKKHPPCTCGYDTAITALRQALAEPDMGIDRGAWDDVPDATKWVDELRGGDETEQEPVAWWNPRYGKGEYAFAEEQSPPDDSNDPSDFGWNIPLYTAPPKREWVGLTDEEREYLWGITPIEDEDRFAFVLAVEAKLKEKNT